MPPILSEHSVAEAASAAGVPGPVHFAPVMESTNTTLVAMAAADAPSWTVAVAGHQVAGRGRLGRTWVSRPQQSLLVSVLLRPDMAPGDAPLLSLAAAVAAVRASRAACDLDVRCKWPNDLVVGDRKLGGILPEAGVKGGALDHVVIGTGMNVTQEAADFPPDLREGATSVALEGGRPDLQGLLRQYLRALLAVTSLPPPEIRRSILAEYLAACDSIGHIVTATAGDGQDVRGMARGIGDRGELLVDTSAGLVPVEFGEVTHLR